MKLQDIEHMKLGVPVAVLVEPELSLVAEAEEVLGYRMKEAQEEAVRAQATIKPLARALRDIEVEVLNPVQVERYKLERKQEAERAALEEAIAARGGRESFHDFSFIRWAETPIEKYRKPIPEFVLSKAIQIKRACLPVELYVEELDDDPDPFLIAKIGYDEYYYVEVWEEPKFEGRR